MDRSIDGPKAFIDNNIIDVFNLLEALRKYSKIKKNIKLIHISTDEVYGDVLFGEVMKNLNINQAHHMQHRKLPQITW